ncbi:GroES-like protein [Atractiella rhizophila]|nr:GroES-like protein [Atractiella rhizophila]
MEVLPNFQFPEKSKAAILNARDKPYTIIHDHPVGKPGKGEVLVKLKVTGLCHSDTMPRHVDGAAGSIIPIIGVFTSHPLRVLFSDDITGGHEGIGIVVARGEGVEAPELGSRVGIRWDANACGGCDVCLSGYETSCKQNMAEYNGYRQHGTFQEYRIAKAPFVVPIPDAIDDLQAAPLMCAGVTVYKGLKLSNPLAGTWVRGGGGLGHLGIQFSKAFGCKVIAIDAPDKEELCKKCGADVFIDFTKSKDVVADVIAATDGGPHTTLVTTAVPSAYTQAILYARPLGTVVFIGLTMASFPTGPMIGKHLKLIGSATGTQRKLEDIETSMQELEKGKISGRIVLRIAD